MLPGLLILGLVLCLAGCGDEAEIEELKAYVKTVQAFQHFNENVQRYITQFDDPSIPVIQADVDAARRLVDDYAAKVASLEEPYESALRHTHGLYARCFDDARLLARDETGDLRRQAYSVVIGLRNLRRDIGDRVYPSIEVLLARKGIGHAEGDEYALPGGLE
ncbi:MAG: hypothetical protein QGI33_07820 [Candidatus Brocadiia bacterium]|jgi:hypothetical protein|nr:hypothetical protein [Candidatus Brocadiia bacterium]